MKFKLLIFFLLNFTFTYSQETDFDSNFFLLGTLSDYMGRQKCNIETDKVDYYHISESSLLKYNYELLKNEYSDLTIDSTNTVLKSKQLTTKINKNFNYSFEEGFFCSTNEDNNGNPKDSLFIGKLKPKIFKTTKEKTSYILGVYTRYSAKNDKSYSISIPNSVSTFPITVKLLKQLGCKKVKTEIIKSIPYRYTIFFEPSKNLEKYLIKYAFLRLKLNEDYNKMKPTF